jgi:hypothetical protein
MRIYLLHSAAWLAALQSIGGPPGLAGDSAHLLGAAGVLGSITVFVYRLGIWRHEMDTTKNTAVAEIKRYREESSVNFERIERRLEAIDHMMTESSELGRRFARFQARTARRLERLEEGRQPNKFDDHRTD